MREIKFRAWDKEYKEWCLPCFHVNTLSKTGDFISHKNDPLVVMQYIGFKDKNGKEIFEGDIVKNQFGSIGVVEYFTKLTWDSGGSDHPGFYCREWFYMGYEDELDYSEGFNDRIEVIGNIYENPELLERE